jgi:hypothetical protein
VRETRDKEREREATEATKRERGYTESGATERERKGEREEPLQCGMEKFFLVSF